MDINKALDRILIKYGIINTTSLDKAIELIQKLENSYLAGRKIGLYGVGIEAEGLLHFISNHVTDLKIYVCFDKTIRKYKYREIIVNTDVRPIECITDVDLDYIILGSYTYRDVFLKNLNEMKYKGEIVDLFGTMEEYIGNHYTDYDRVYKVRQAYRKAEKDDKIRLLGALIKEYILLKDFNHAFCYIDEYVGKRYTYYERYLGLKKDLKILLDQIKKNINRRKKKDIIINWIDALSYYDIPDFTFIQQKEKEGVCFKNAYTVMPWTTETTKTILYGGYPIEDKLFLEEFISADRAKLLRILQENEYRFVYCGMPKFAKLFDSSVITPLCHYENKFTGSMQKQWNALHTLCCCEEAVCILIHTLRETHEPFICGDGDTFIQFGSTERDWQQEDCIRQAKKAGEYINGQLAFYENFYKENAIEIYMSDHGRVGNSPMDEKKIHIMLTISGGNIQHESVEGMFSLVRFPELIKKIIMNTPSWKSLTSDYVLVQNLDAYNELVVEDTLAGRLTRDEMYQCRGIVTREDRYYRYAYGKEYYFTSAESKQNEMGNPEFRARVLELRRLCGDEFIDIYKYDKFLYSRRLYTDVNRTDGEGVDRRV